VALGYYRLSCRVARAFGVSNHARFRYVASFPEALQAKGIVPARIRHYRNRADISANGIQCDFANIPYIPPPSCFRCKRSQVQSLTIAQQQILEDTSMCPPPCSGLCDARLKRQQSHAASQGQAGSRFDAPEVDAKRCSMCILLN